MTNEEILRKLIDKALAVNLLHYSRTSDISLAKGLAGNCLMLYEVSRNNAFVHLHQRINDEIEKIAGGISIHMPLDLYSGMAGVGIAITQFCNFRLIEQSPDILLHDIDSHIYRIVWQGILNQHSMEPSDNSSVDILVYLSFRLLVSMNNIEEREIYIALCERLFDKIYYNLSDKFLEEPLPGNLSYKLPKLLLAMSMMHDAGVYRERICNCCKEIRLKIFTILPFSGFNQLMFVISMMRLASSIRDSEWISHANLLTQTINMNDAMRRFLESYDIYPDGGTAGMYVLAYIHNKMFLDNPIAISHAQMLNDIKRLALYLISSDIKDILPGLAGISGIVLIFNEMLYGKN